MAHPPYVAVPQTTYDRYHIHTHKLAFFYSIPDKYSLSHQSPNRSKKTAHLERIFLFLCTQRVCFVI